MCFGLIWCGLQQPLLCAACHAADALHSMSRVPCHAHFGVPLLCSFWPFLILCLLSQCSGNHG